MTCACYGEDIIEGHSHICDDDSLDCFTKSCCTFSSCFIVMFMSSYFPIKFPYDIEEEYSTEEFESRDFHEKYNSEREEDTQYRSTCHSPKYSFFPYFWWEIFCCHSYEDSIITAHHEIYEDDIEKCKCSCTRKKMSKIGRKCFKHREKL